MAPWGAYKGTGDGFSDRLEVTGAAVAEFTVSVVIPALNEGPRVGRAIQSVLRQTHPVNEIIVVDDGSTDNTAEAVARFGDAVVLIRQANQGAAAARNAGLRRAGSEWVAFLDADDEWLPDHIEAARESISRHPEVVWYSAAFEQRSESGAHLYRAQADPALLHDGVIEDYFLAAPRTDFAVNGMLVRRSVFDAVGLFNAQLGRGEDVDMWFRIACRYPRLAYSNALASIYWRRQGSLTGPPVPSTSPPI